MKTNHRREFVKKALAGLTGAAVLPAAIKAGVIEQPSQKELPVRTLGKTGVKIPLFSMGTGDTSNPALIKAAIDAGITLFGTSTYYGNGNNETLLGGLLKTLPRDGYMVATSSMPKGTDHQNGLFTDATAATSFQADIEASMKRLNVEYLDILFLPFAAKRESVFFEPLLRVMENFKKSGKARFIGIATHSYVDEAIRAAADTGIYDVVMAAYNFRLQKLQEVTDAVEYGAKAGLGMIAMKSMAGGYWDKDRKEPINSDAALKWVLQNPHIHTIMSGMTTFEELQRNITLMQQPDFTDDDRKALKLAQTGSAESLFCLQCRECLGQCPGGLDIPTIMRSYMYAYGYRNLHHAQQTLGMAGLPAEVCTNCETCSVQCRNGFNVKEKIRDIARLRDIPQDFIYA